LYISQEKIAIFFSITHPCPIKYLKIIERNGENDGGEIFIPFPKGFKNADKLWKFTAMLIQ
jgi:hypothetical protein